MNKTLISRMLAVAAGIAALIAGVLLLSKNSDDDTSSATTQAATTTASSSELASGSADGVVGKAQAFLATLDESQKTALQQQYSLSNAQKWSNFPQALVRGNSKRIGLQLSSLSSDQKAAFVQMMKSVSGSDVNEGWDEMQQLLNMDDYLATKDSGGGPGGSGSTPMYGSGNYYVAFLGTPSDTGTWELQFGGHHLAFANTYKDGQLAGATPSFRASEPLEEVKQNGVSNKPLVQERDAFAKLLGSLTTAQKAKAKLSGTMGDIIAGPQQDWQFPKTAEGIAVSKLDAAQKSLLTTAIRKYVADIDSKNAAVILKKYADELDKTYVSFSGGTDLKTVNDYIRIDGPSLWIEYSTQRGIVESSPHPHSVWRDKTSDYGGTRS